MNCRVCDNPVKAFMSFGQQPIANRFISPDQTESEYFFEMEVCVCSQCGMFQLIEQPAPEMMFHENYTFFSKTSKAMQIHFEAYAKYVMDTYLADDPFVVELGSNDGIMLRHFKNAGHRHIGIEPSDNVAEVARKDGVHTLTAFFGEETAQSISKEYGLADAILSANVMCHIPDINGIAKGAVALLKPEGVLIFEDPYLGDVVEKTSYDQIYDEHVYLFSATSVKNSFKPHGLILIDVLPQTTHGGSMRYVLGREGQHKVGDAVTRQLAWETERGLTEAKTFEKFRTNCEKSRDKLVSLLTQLKSENRRVVGYAATSKSTTILNYCGIGPDLIEYISDTTPDKQGTLSPGMHISVKPHSYFAQNYPDYVVLFAWNHEIEIRANERDYTARGGKWIYFVPDVVIDTGE